MGGLSVWPGGSVTRLYVRLVGSPTDPAVFGDWLRSVPELRLAVSGGWRSGGTGPSAAINDLSVSVVTPRTLQVLAEALRSWLAQDLPGVEIEVSRIGGPQARLDSRLAVVAQIVPVLEAVVGTVGLDHVIAPPPAPEPRRDSVRRRDVASGRRSSAAPRSGPAPGVLILAVAALVVAVVLLLVTLGAFFR